MNDLALIRPELPGALTVAEIDAAMAYAGAEKAQAPRQAYASDWRDFAAYLSGPADDQRRGRQAPQRR